MSRTKLRILAAVTLAGTGMSTLAVSTAAAAFTLTETECGAGLPVFCYENEVSKKLFTFKGTEEFTGIQEASEPHLLKGNLGENIRIECATGNLTGGLNQEEALVKVASLSNLVGKFKGCKLTETAALVAKCKINQEEIDTNSLKGELENMDPPDIHLTPTEGAVIAVISLEDNEAQVCPATVRGGKMVKGLQLCELLEAEVDASVKLLQCTPTGSELTLGENVAEFDAEFELKLKNTIDRWSVGLA